MNEDPTARFLGPATGLIDDYIAFSVNKIATRDLMKLYKNHAAYTGSGGNYMVVQDKNSNYVAVIGTQDPDKTLLMRSPSFALLAVGGLQNTSIGGKPMIPGK
jgi:hypothetical protein